MSGMRLRSVRMKSGGAKVRVLHNAKPDPTDNLQGEVLRHARLASSYGNQQAPLDGFVVIALYSDGCTSVGFKLPGRLPPTLATAFLCEVIRRDLTVQNEANRVFDERFEWVDG